MGGQDQCSFHASLPYEHADAHTPPGRPLHQGCASIVGGVAKCVCVCLLYDGVAKNIFETGPFQIIRIKSDRWPG